MSLFGRWRDQSSTQNIKAYQLPAGAVVLKTYDQTERIRSEFVLVGSHPWRAAEIVRVRLLAMWVTQSCFTAADRMFQTAKEVAGRDDVLPMTQVSWIETIYRLGHEWAPRMEQALAGDRYVLDTRLPVALPRVARPRDLSEADVETVLAMVEALWSQVDLIWGEIDCVYELPAEFRPWKDPIRQQHVRVNSMLEQQRDFWVGRPGGDVRQELYERLLTLADDCLRLGQYVVMPRLLDPSLTLRTDRVAAAAAGARPAGSDRTPQQRMLLILRQWLGFDPWLLTAPERRADGARDALNELDRFWRQDPDPRATKEVHDRIAAALAAGHLERRGDEALRDCPWSPVYVAKQTVNVGERVGRGTIFAFQPGHVGGVFTHQLKRLGTDPAYGDRPRAPGPDGTDLWIITDPEVQDRLAGNPDAVRQLAELWAADDDPERTKALCLQVVSAETTGKIRRRPARMAWGACPWPPTFVALERVGIGGENIRPGEVFTFTVDVADGRFARRIIRIGRYAAAAPVKP